MPLQTHSLEHRSLCPPRGGSGDLSSPKLRVLGFLGDFGVGIKAWDFGFWGFGFRVWGFSGFEFMAQGLRGFRAWGRGLCGFGALGSGLGGV